MSGLVKTILRFKCGHVGVTRLRPETARAILRATAQKDCMDCLARARPRETEASATRPWAINYGRLTAKQSAILDAHLAFTREQRKGN